MSEVLIRDGRTEDHPALVDLWVAAWTLAMPAIDFEARRTWFVAHQARLSSEGHRTIVVTARDGTVRGFLTLEPTEGYVDQLAVAPSAQGRGLAGALVAAAKCVSPSGLALHVNQDNSRAVRFYEREGFSITGAGVNTHSGRPVWSMQWQPHARAHRLRWLHRSNHVAEFTSVDREDSRG